MRNEREPNPSQRAVIENLTDNLLLYAAAGTGKTFTVARRIQNILRRNLARPEEILCLTFTQKAAEEMKEDILSACPEGAQVRVKTIHGFCYDLLKEEARRSETAYLEPVVIDEEDEEEALKRILPSVLSRFALEKRLKELGFSGGVQDLFARDVYFLKGRGYCWRVPYGGGAIYLNARGVVRAEEARPLHADEVAECPGCKRNIANAKNICPRCGFDLRTYIEPIPFKIKAFRPIVSLVKRFRALFDLQSGDEAQDLQAAFLRLQRGGGQQFSSAVSENGRADETFLALMQECGGAAIAAYNAALTQNNRLDFDDLILCASRLLTGETLQRTRARFPFITVDEMQDTSTLEYALLSRLFPGNNVMLCGDPFQTIYEWRGSSPKRIARDFIETYHAKEVSLSVNYRSTKTLLRAATGYLTNLSEEGGARETEPSAAEEGDPVRLVTLKSEREEAEWIYRYLKKHRALSAAGESDSGKALHENSVCILARSNRYINSLEARFSEIEQNYGADERLSFFTVDGDFRFFKKPVVKDVLAFWNLLVANDGAALSRIAPKYIRGVGEATVAAVEAQNELGVSLASFLEEGAYKAFEPYEPLLKAVNEGNLVVYDLETTGLDVERDGAVQIAAVKIDRKGIKQEFLAYLNPAIPMDGDAVKTHGFTEEFLKAHATPSKEAYEKFREFTKGAVLLGHNNLQFDRSIVRRELRELHLPPLEIVGEYDTLALAKLFYPRFRNYKLSTLCEAFGIVNERAHDASSDIAATQKAFFYLLEHDLIPSALARRQFVKKYAPRFERFFTALRGWRETFRFGEFAALNREIATSANLIGRNKSAFAERDVKEIFSIGEERVARTGDGHGAILSLLSEAALAGSKMDVLLKKTNKIPVITVHGAKGCEFDTVIVAGADENNFPSYFAVKSGNGEEEKRVFYVALTRAKKRLVITHAAYSNAGVFREESPYLSLLPADCVTRYESENKK